MEISINQDRKLFVIKTSGGYSCLGFDVVFKRLKQIVSSLGLSLRVDEREKGTLPQYMVYQQAIDEYAKAGINETFFDPDTPDKVRRILERYRKSGDALRVFYGDPVTGKDWLDENDVVGTVGRSCGIFKVPLLVEEGESGGPALLDHCVVRMTDGKTGRELYRHPTYNQPEFEIRPVEETDPIAKRGYTHGVWARNGNGEFERHANFESYGKACKYVAFITGESVCKP